MVNKEGWESSALHKAVTEMAFLTPWKFIVLPSHFKKDKKIGGKNCFRSKTQTLVSQTCKIA
jgi:hypothetical protein